MLLNSNYITRSKVITHHHQHLIYNNVTKMHSDYQVYHDGRTRARKIAAKTMPIQVENIRKCVYLLKAFFFSCVSSLNCIYLI